MFFNVLWQFRLSVIGAIGRAGLRKEVGLLMPGPRGPKVLRHHEVYSGVTADQSTRDTGNEDDSSFAGFLNLTCEFYSAALGADIW